MTSKVEINLREGKLLVEGSEGFVREIYLDFRSKLDKNDKTDLNQGKSESFETEHESEVTNIQTQKPTIRKINQKGKAKGTKGISTSKPALITNLNLRPTDKPSLREFIKNYVIKSDMERVLFITFYLTNFLNESEITVNHIYTGYKELEAKVPTALHQVIRNAHNRKGWVEIEESGIKVTIQGENYVNFDAEKVGGVD